MSYTSLLTTPSATNDEHTTKVLDAFKAEVNAHPAWEFVETVAGGTGGRTDVFRLPASQSGEEKDVYVLSHKTNNTSAVVYFGVAEDYDPVTKKVLRYVPFNSGGTNVLSANQADDSFQTVSSGSPVWAHVFNDIYPVKSSGSPAPILTISSTLVGQQTSMLMSITNKRIVFVITTIISSQRTFYFGWTEKPAGSLWRGGFGGFSVFDNAYTAVTRAPYNKGPLSFELYTIISALGLSAAYKDVNLNSYVVRELWAQSSTDQHLYGRLYDLLDVGVSGVAYDDRATLNGVEHAFVGKSRLWVPVTV